MILVNLALYEQTKESQYLIRAARIARAAVQRWIDPATGGVHDSGRFAHLLLEALYEYADAAGNDGAELRATIGRSAEYVHERLRDENGDTQVVGTTPLHGLWNEQTYRSS
jgi:glutathione S-transferase